jgi:hypothetical protein
VPVDDREIVLVTEPERAQELMGRREHGPRAFQRGNAQREGVHETGPPVREQLPQRVLAQSAETADGDRDIGDLKPDGLEARKLPAELLALADVPSSQIVRAFERTEDPPGVECKRERDVALRDRGPVWHELDHRGEGGELDGPNDDEVPPFQAEVEDYWRYARAATVAAGTVEIQRTLVARAVLGGR